MPRHASEVVSLLLALLLVLSDVPTLGPTQLGTDAASSTVVPRVPGRTNDPALSGKQARRQHDRKQKRRHERQQDRTHERNHTDHQRDVNTKRARARGGATAQQCADAELLRLRGLGLCTHGPDEAPPGFNPKSDAPLPSDAVAAQAAESISCDGDGQSGFRTQVLYIHRTDRTSRYSTLLSSLQAWSAEMDSIFRGSSMETGPVRSIRFVQDPSSCLPIIPDVAVSPSAINSFGATINQLVSKGYSRQDRIYLMFVDANTYCGIGTFGDDDSPYAENTNNVGPSYARVDAGCWSGAVASHEVMHNLGGVQLSAPHTSGGAHCIDEYDIMCYSDSPYYPQMQYFCPTQTDDDTLLDCDHDDYFNTAPATGSYLATHWNPANNRFLTNAPPLPAAPPPTAPAVGPDSGNAGRTSRQRHRDRKHRKQQNGRHRR